MDKRIHIKNGVSSSMSGVTLLEAGSHKVSENNIFYFGDMGTNGSIANTSSNISGKSKIPMKPSNNMYTKHHQTHVVWNGQTTGGDGMNEDEGDILYANEEMGYMNGDEVLWDDGECMYTNSENDESEKELDYNFTESDDEGEREYRKGGYHPVKVGEIYNDRFRIEGKLGWGHFSTVWLATDLNNDPLSYVAIKFQKSAPRYFRAAMREIALLDYTNKVIKSKRYNIPEALDEMVFKNGSNYGVVGYVDHFFHVGPHGKHACLVFDLMGPNVLTLMKKYDFKGIPMSLVRQIALHVLIGLDFLHRGCKIVHADLKPENIVISSQRLPPPRSNQKAAILASTIDWDSIEWSKLSTEERKRLKKKKKKQMNRERRRKKMELESLLKPPDTSAIVGNSFTEQYQLAEADTCLTPAYNKLNEIALQALKDTTVVTEDEILAKEEEGEKGAPPYVKHILKSSSSDPSLLTTYRNAHAVSDAAKRLKQQHIRGDTAFVYGFDEAKSIITDMVSLNSLERGDDVSLRNGVDTNHTEENETTKKGSGKETYIETSEGPIRIKPAELDVFFENDAVFKICDLGSACTLQDANFDSIQTRQYRSPEVIIQYGYDTSADIWSYACMIYELVTGDYLFEPHSAENYNQDEDHLALIMEYLGGFPPHMIENAELSGVFFTPGTGSLRRFPNLNSYNLTDVITSKCNVTEEEAASLVSFLEPMLLLDPAERPTAEMMLHHPWLEAAKKMGSNSFDDMANLDSTRVSDPPTDCQHIQQQPTPDVSDDIHYPHNNCGASNDVTNLEVFLKDGKQSQNSVNLNNSDVKKGQDNHSSVKHEEEPELQNNNNLMEGVAFCGELIPEQPRIPMYLDPVSSLAQEELSEVSDGYTEAFLKHCNSSSNIRSLSDPVCYANGMEDEFDVLNGKGVAMEEVLSEVDRDEVEAVNDEGMKKYMTWWDDRPYLKCESPSQEMVDGGEWVVRKGVHDEKREDDTSDMNDGHHRISSSAECNDLLQKNVVGKDTDYSVTTSSYLVTHSKESSLLVPHIDSDCMLQRLDTIEEDEEFYDVEESE